ncbi:golvesin C-terminal-like domain-containing protein [Thermophagus sp. OGC60D27]|uniref:golvesin C-terminal-like domain-containing protein n=1 Tax=Thermophagus sp. OGC60D27 TaxID=3458415 RepID=UPI004037B13B
MKKNVIKIKSAACKVLMSAILFFHFAGIQSQVNSRELRLAEKAMDDISAASLFQGWDYLGKMDIDSIFIDSDNKIAKIHLSQNVTRIPIRYLWIEQLTTQIRDQLRRKFRNYNIQLFCKGLPLKEFIPVYYQNGEPNSDRLKQPSSQEKLVTNHSEPIFSKGLSNNHIALWPSHGYYYDAELDRWEWQRARLFGTVEDIYPFSFTQNFLVPMLEDAGATVFLPRERDTQTREVIVDNDGSYGKSELIINPGDGAWTQNSTRGFAAKDTLLEGENPFLLGTYLKMKVKPDVSGRLKYVPEIPESGEYAVYISWGKEEEALTNVPCTVNHSGGQTRFTLNQQMGYGTWIYIGTFHFQKGLNPETGSVVLSSPENATGTISADAVRFGGGMGNVARRPSQEYIPNKWSLNNNKDLPEKKLRHNTEQYTYKLSGKPRWMEGARYWLQYAGIPDSIVYSLNDNKNDYNDDYQSRGEWVNFLMGNPNGPTGNRQVEGLNIPIDLAFAFHTDAGTTPNDSIIGTLGIYSSLRNNGQFPDGSSKLASRDLTDLIQTQIVSDIRLSFNERWTRRAMWDKQYSEAWRPNVPTMLLELLSHQNLADMKYGLDPRFQFTVARAIYKGMARFLATRESRPVVIQPLAPKNMALEMVEGKKVKLSWSPEKDPVEPSAIPTGYIVYQRMEDNGFDNGVFTSDTSMIVELDEYSTIYSFKVRAVNEGGQSFPGETLSVSIDQNSKEVVLVVNAFDRVAPPAFVEGEMAGVAWWEDEGVPWNKDLSHTGRQYDYHRSSPWLDDDSPGHGASFADMEGKIIPGNNHDFIFLHGQALRNAGYSFVSVSDERFGNQNFDVNPYFAIDIIYGEERGTPALYDRTKKDFRVLTSATRAKIQEYLEQGGNILISGAYIGTDLVENNDSAAIDFAKNVLHYRWMTNHADNGGLLTATDPASPYFIPKVQYNTRYHPGIYKVEAPDGIEPVGDGAFRIYRYANSKVSGGVAYSGNYKCVILGFPIETMPRSHEQNQLIKDILNFFRRD